MEHDGVDAEISGMWRAGVMAAGRIAEQVARLHENQKRHAEATSAQAARELQTRLDTERLAARAQLAVVGKDEWWETAQPEDVVDLWQTAHAWRTVDPEIEKAATRIEDEVRARWGVDVHNTGAKPDEIRDHLRRALDAKLEAEAELTQAEKLEKQALEILVEADRMEADRERGLVDDIPADEAREDSLRQQAAALTSDAKEHRDRAAAYSTIEDGEAKEAKMVADNGQGMPARMATAKAGKASKRSRRPSSEAAQEHTISR